MKYLEQAFLTSFTAEVLIIISSEIMLARVNHVSPGFLCILPVESYNTGSMHRKPVVNRSIDNWKNSFRLL